MIQIKDDYYHSIIQDYYIGEKDYYTDFQMDIKVYSTFKNKVIVNDNKEYNFVCRIRFYMVYDNKIDRNIIYSIYFNKNNINHFDEFEEGFQDFIYKNQQFLKYFNIKGYIRNLKICEILN